MRDEGGVVVPRPYDGGLEAMDVSNAELPEALEAAAGFHWLRQDWQGAFTAYSKLLEYQVSTDASFSTLCALMQCASELGRWEEAEEFNRLANTILAETEDGSDDETESDDEPGAFASIARWLRPPADDAISEETDGDSDRDEEPGVLESVMLWVRPREEEVLERTERDRVDHVCCLTPGLLWCYCAVDDALDDTLEGTSNREQSKWCVDDSAVERVFIPEGAVRILAFTRPYFPRVFSCKLCVAEAARSLDRPHAQPPLFPPVFCCGCCVLLCVVISNFI